MKKLIYASLITLSSLAYGKSSTKEIGTLVIGTVFPMSGPQAPYGQEAMAGVQLAYERLLAEEPETAVHIKLLQGDDASTPNGATLAAEDLIKQRVSIFIGSVNNVSSRALVEVAERHKKPLIVPASSSLSLAKETSYTFRSCFVDKWQGMLLGNFAIAELAKKKAAVLLNPQDTYAHDIVEFFKNSFSSQGGEIVLKELYTAKEASFHEQLKKIAASPAEFIVFPTSSYHEAATVMAAMKKLKLKLPLLGGDRWNTPQLALKAGSAYSGHFYPGAFSAQIDSESNKQFVAAFKRKLRRYPSALAAMTYDAFLLAVDAFKRAETVRSNELTRALARTRDLQGLLGPLSINPDHTAEKPGVMMETTAQGSRLRTVVSPRPVISQKG